ncbi:hypothetical protein [Aurantiacibacter poecillastricola]|uniref:hypothetical protein n=1 Tax=Aurantiacibacter poecillastricola TaxID=3064385 RepID=UPI00273EF80F|nr:hypothetical protein [Aurantiacibacter sp. 219JJ12-13]MDP5262670.1 hypothetical protein [Aurantiacibacter sp. 219JJ12-13]
MKRRFMGNAYSSALRSEDAMITSSAANAEGPAYGSLEGLGGPRKFKKKPVLVLAPEELEKAHALFQEASAEMLGEEIQRPSRPAAVLGLVPMNRDSAEPEDKGETDEADDDTDVIAAAGDMLRVSAARQAADDIDDAAIAAQLEGLDIEQRIFPRLPLKSEEELSSEEEAERASAEGKATLEDPRSGEAASDFQTDFGTPPIRFETEEEPANPYVSPFDQSLGITNAHPIDDEPEAPDPEPAELAMPDEPSDITSETDPVAEFEEHSDGLSKAARNPFGDAPFLDFPEGPLRYSVQPENFVAADTEPATDAFAEDEPHENSFDVYSREDEAPDTGFHDFEHDTDLEPDPETSPVAEAEDGSHYTEIDEEPVDGYAFMYASNTRGRTLNALADGQSNSLRAKLIKEREEASDEVPHNTSLWARFTSWLRGLFG